jgi:hypothetical protein
MLSSQSTRRTNKHQRQSSIPLTPLLEMDSSYFPVTYTQGFNQNSLGHRRGNSLDQSIRLQDSTTTATALTNLGNGKVSTNPGLYEQQTLRETQMHGLPRPGPCNNLEDIFEDITTTATTTTTNTTTNNNGKDFSDFGSIGMDDSFSAAFEPIITSSNKQGKALSRPHTPGNQLSNGMTTEILARMLFNF